MAEALLRIGELSERTGLGQRAIHYYESIGLLRPVQRTGKGYRYYDTATVTRIEKIQALKQVGLSLEEILSVIDAYFEDGTMAKGKRKVLAILQQHLAELDVRIDTLNHHRAELQGHITRIQAHLDALAHPSS